MRAAGASRGPSPSIFLGAPTRASCPLTQTAMSPRSRYSLVLVLLLVASACVALGFWQLGRLHRRKAANRIAIGARALPVVNLDAPHPPATMLLERRVAVTGVYDDQHDLLVRGQAREGAPGVVLVTPLRLAGSDTAVIVERGFVPSNDAITARPDTLREPGTVGVTGLALPLTAGGGQPITRNGVMTYRRLDLAALRGSLPYPILPLVVRRLADSTAPDSAAPAGVFALAPPSLDNGPHLNYAIQWFAFATTALIFAGVIGVKGLGDGR